MLGTQSILFFIFSRCSLYVEVIDGQSFTTERRIVRLRPFDKWKLQSENRVESPVHAT